MTDLKPKVAKGAVWAIAEKLSCQAAQFVVGMILARLLTPTEYGTVALVAIFTMLASVLADSGLGNALVQKKNATELDFNSVFYLSVVLGFGIYLVLFLAAPVVAAFYDMTVLTDVIRVLAVSVIFNAINSVQTAELQRKLLFDLSFRISLIAVMSSATVGITLAYMGFGVWALVWSSIASGFVGVLTRWYYIAWRPAWMFSWSALKPLFTFGWKMTASALLEVGFNNLYGLCIGKFYSSADLAFVNKGRHFPELVMNNVNGTLGQVAFPALAQLQDDRQRLRDGMRRMMVCSTYLVFPLMAFCAINAEQILLVIFGSQWLPAKPYMQLACFSFALWPFYTINLQGIQAIGRSDVYLKLEVVKKIVGVVFLVLFITRGVFLYMAVTAIVAGPLGVLINGWPNRRLLDYPIGTQVRDVLPSFFVTMVSMAPICLLCVFFPVNSFWGRMAFLIVQSIVAFSVFCSVSLLLKPRPVREIAELFVPKMACCCPKLAALLGRLSKGR